MHPVVTDLFISGVKLNISFVFITKSYFPVPKDLRLNTKHFFIMKIPDKQELQYIAINHLSDTDFQEIKRLYRKCSAYIYSFLVIDTTLTSNNPSLFRNNCWQKYVE